MASYIDLPLEVDSDTLAAQALDTLIANIPGYTPQEGHLEVWLIEVLARMEAETREVATRVPPSIFKYFGKTLLNLPAVEAAKASTFSTWTVVDSAGYTIPAGTVVAFTPTGSSSVYFEVARDVVVAPGQTSTTAGEVELVALDAGTAANGLPAGPVQLVDALVFITSVTTTAVTSGGADAESDDEYRDRLHDELELLSPRPILPADFATLAKRIPGVDRAVAIDGYNPGNGTYNNERMIAVAVCNEAGNAVPSNVKTAVQTYLDSLREVNFVVNVIDPTFTQVNVTATLRLVAGADRATVVTAATEAVRNYLSPQSWDWRTTVRYNELIVLLDGVAGVDYVETISVPSGDVILPGVAALVRAGTVSISAT